MKKRKSSMNPKDLLGLKKVPLRLLSPISLVQQAVALNLGANVKGYGPYNWRKKKVLYSVYLEAIFRHLLLIEDGEDSDYQSLGPHESSIMACCTIILDAKATGNLVDDRDKTGRLGQLMTEIENILIKQKIIYATEQKQKKRKKK